MPEALYSIRMRASRDRQHISGVERIGPAAELRHLAAEMVGRALGHSRGAAERIDLTLEAIDPAAIRRGRLPDITTVRVADFMQGRRAAVSHLVAAGVAESVAAGTVEMLARGAAPGGGSMRGAMLIDAVSGARLEPDRARGVRASRMDLTAGAGERLRGALAARGLDNAHVREALVLAAKVLAAPGVMAELCWSDDPDYTAGYVSSGDFGYVRFPHLKPQGEERGGRAFFLRPGAALEEVIHHLENVVLLVDEIGVVHPDRTWEG